MTVVIRDLWFFYFIDKKLAAYNGNFLLSIKCTNIYFIRNFNEYQKCRYQEKFIMYMYMPMQT